ncbi:MAG: hypothetical protein MK198_00275 [Gracilimonas sp.]|uniref:hypothetical protein n=1 Tax=Gracilimonas sp. TaxID=1974203 RepID=UPI003752F7E4|nr:hypothetical protein [Gracilimonas sp.]
MKILVWNWRKNISHWKPKLLMRSGSTTSAEELRTRKKRRKLMLNKQVYLDEDFKTLWDKINKKTRY